MGYIWVIRGLYMGHRGQQLVTYGSYMSYMGQPWYIRAIYRLSEKAGRPTGIKQRWNLGVLESGGSAFGHSVWHLYSVFAEQINAYSWLHRLDQLQTLPQCRYHITSVTTNL